MSHQIPYRLNPRLHDRIGRVHGWGWGRRYGRSDATAPVMAHDNDVLDAEGSNSVGDDRVSVDE